MSPFGDARVRVFDPSEPMDALQQELDAIFAVQESDEFGAGRHALLFRPGVYDLTIRVGFYTHVAGLGASPSDVVIQGGVTANGAWDRGHVTRNFWRSVENLTVEPASGEDRWAVSQASPYRRVHVKGDLRLDDGGWASGGYFADTVVDGTVRSGSQQQWFSRCCRFGAWEGSHWNMVFAGVEGAPDGTGWPEPPHTVVAHAGRFREKPFLMERDRRGGVFVPAFRDQAVGPSWTNGSAPGVWHGLDEFHVAHESESSASLNAALDAGLSLLFPPGTYKLDAPLSVTRPGTVVLGFGWATLVPTAGNAVLRIGDVEATIAGLLLDAGPVNSPVLLEVGSPGSTGDARRPVVLHDIFVRVGGRTPGRASISVAVHTNHVLADHFWLWRADHGCPGSFGWDLNPAANGLVVTGDNVTIWGLFVEHYQEYQVLWSGERGRVVFYQSEIPYDPPTQDAYRADELGWAAYKVAEGVANHEANGLGIYCYFRANPELKLGHAIEAPEGEGIRFERITTVSLGGGVGEIVHPINAKGPAARPGQTVARWR